ncbi:MAG: hypothetical protein ABL894_05415 [Hyphomicrobium sp.]
MSGSFDPKTGRPHSPQGPQPGYESYDDYVTGPVTGQAAGPPVTPDMGPVTGAPFASYEEPVYADDPRYPATDPFPGGMTAPPAARPTLAAENRGGMYAPARTLKKNGEQTSAPVVPAGSVTGRSLTLVITIMCFLACLTAGAVYMINQSATAWLKDIASEVTVQVEPQDGGDIEKSIAEISAFLGGQAGITKVKALSVETSAELLEPWLGKSAAGPQADCYRTRSDRATRSHARGERFGKEVQGCEPR